MKKIILIAAMVLGFAVAADAQGWRAGARVGSGFQAQGEYCYNGSNYIEGRFGMGWASLAGEGLAAEFTALHNWNVCTMDWTPSAGQWFFDAGVGVTVGGRESLANVGVAGCAKLGIEFNDAPVRLSLDFTPAFGPLIVYAPGYGSYARFNEYNIANLGISAVFCF